MISIKDKKNCCGCSACVQRCPKQCIEMYEDNEGFLYPKVDASKCIDCHLCEKVCPVINQNEPREPLAVYAAKNPDDAVRMQSSSGGIFTMLAERVIDEGGVVFGACWDEEWNVKHDYAETREGLAKFRSSKYLQSVIGNSYQEAECFLKEGRRVMFTGTPCQIAGLKHFLRKDYDNLLAVDIVCHSVPSPGVWQQYLQEKLHDLKWDKRNIRRISFRDKTTGWKAYSFLIEERNGHSFTEKGGENSFMRGFLADLYTRPSCHECPAKQLKSGSDITLGDFWGITSMMPEIDDDRGTSVVIVSTKKGSDVWEELGVQCYLTFYGKVSKLNPAIVKSVACSINNRQFFSQGGKKFEEKVKVLTRPSFSWRALASNLIHRLLLKRQ